MLQTSNVFFPSGMYKSLFSGFLLMLFYIIINTNPVNAQWVPTSGLEPGVPVRCFTVKDNILFAGNWAGAYGNGGAYRTTNDGTNWIGTNSGLTDTAVFGFAVSGTYLFAGTLGGGVFRSSNNGTTWNQVNAGLTNTTVYSIFATGTDLYAGTGNGVFRSTNNGTSWGFTGLTGYIVPAFEVVGANLFAGVQGYGVFRSSDNGVNWTEVNTSLTNQAVLCLAVMGTKLYAGTMSGVFYTSNNGASWVNTLALAGLTINTLAVSGTNIFAGFSGGGVALSTNNGTNWTSVGTGIPNTMVNSLYVNGTLIFAGTLSGTVYKRPLSQIVSSIKQISNELPDKFSLNQNYPNPFNPVTKIKFSIPLNAKGETSNVKMIVYDITGKEMTTLLNEKLSPGSYEVDFDGSNLSSGVYFYKLETGRFIDTKKMILLK